MDFSPLDEDPPPKLDWSKPSLAVVAKTASGTGGCVLWTAGPHVDSLISEAGVTDLDLLGLDDAPEGISIWEGILRTKHIHTPDCNEYDSWLEGSFREPTEDEWIAIRRGECPWDEGPWVLPSKYTTRRYSAVHRVVSPGHVSAGDGHLQTCDTSKFGVGDDIVQVHSTGEWVLLARLGLSNIPLGSTLEEVMEHVIVPRKDKS